MAKRKHPKPQKSRARRPQSQPGSGRRREPDAPVPKDAGPGIARPEGPNTLRLWGLHPVRAALLNRQRRVTGGYITSSARTALVAEGVAENLLSQLQIATTREIETQLPDGAVHQGVCIQVAPLPRADLPDVAADIAAAEDNNGLLVVLDQVTDPHNVGAIMRSCAVFGARALVTTDRNAPPESGTLAKSAAGALDVLPWVRVGNLAQSLDRLKQDGWWVVGLAGEARTAIADTLPGSEPAKIALVLGAEGSGLRRLTKEKCDILVRIPMSYDNNEKCVNLIDSLNVSNAAAVALYELCRR